MDLTLSLEARYFRTPDQKIWVAGSSDITFWRRYLSSFDSIQVIARVKNVPHVLPNCKQANGAKIKFIPLPYYIGPAQYLRESYKIKKIISLAVRNSQALILRPPGQISGCVYKELKKVNRPYGLEVVGDPFDVFAPGAVDHIFRPFFRRIETKRLKEQCMNASAVSYVCEKELKRRYPTRGFSTNYSSIDLSEDAFAGSPVDTFGTNGIFTLVFVGSLAQLYKAPDVLINAVSLCIKIGLKVRLKIVGDGKFKTELENLVANLGLTNSVKFLGELPPGEAVRYELQQSDMFILPSRTEGLPRAMIEAMACGLPCIGTNVGGIPELLSPEDLVNIGDAKHLARTIEKCIANPKRMFAMSTRNLKKASKYKKSILDQRREDFYNYLRDQTAIWMQDIRT